MEASSASNLAEAIRRRRPDPMHLRRFLTILILMATCAAPVVAGAQPVDHPGPGRGPMAMGDRGGGPMPMPLMMFLRQAKLTPDQDAKVHQIMAASFAKTRPLMEQLHKIHDQISDKLLSPGPVTANDIAPLQQMDSQIHQQIDQQMVSTALQIRGVLTPQQLARVADLHQKLDSLREQIHALMGDDEGAPPAGPPGVL